MVSLENERHVDKHLLQGANSYQDENAFLIYLAELFPDNKKSLFLGYHCYFKLNTDRGDDHVEGMDDMNSIKGE